MEKTALNVKKEFVAVKERRSIKIPASVIPKTGKRKASIAKVWMLSSSQVVMRSNFDIDQEYPQSFITINNKDFTQFFPKGLMNKCFNAITRPFRAAGLDHRSYKVIVTVVGGGLTGQVDAIVLGIAKNIAALDEEYRYSLRKMGLLTRDPRAVESKKIGKRKARKRRQYSKR